MASFTPGTSTPKPDALALDEPKMLGALISSAVSLWTRKPGVFLMTAALLVIPFEVIVLGLFGGGFNHADGAADPWAEVLSVLMVNTLITALVTATHSRSVVALAEGRTLSTGEAFRLGLSGFGTVLLAGIVYFLATVLGTIALIIPGIFIAVAGVFAPQIAALEGTGPIDSLKASVRLAREAGWWRTWGYLFVISLISTAFGAVAGFVLGIASVATDASWFGAVVIITMAIIEAVALSFTALIITLLYFSWRAQTGNAASADGHTPSGAQPDFMG